MCFLQTKEKLIVLYVDILIKYKKFKHFYKEIFI